MNDPRHDPGRFYHCDCIEDGYDPNADRLDKAETEVHRLQTQVTYLESEVARLLAEKENKV